MFSFFFFALCALHIDSRNEASEREEKRKIDVENKRGM